MHPCVQAILCGLGNAVISSLRASIGGVLAQLTAQLAALQVLLAQAQLATVSARALAAIAQPAVDQIRAVGDLVPVQLMAGCVDLGDTFIALSAGLDIAVADLERVLGDANLQIDFVNSLNARIADLEAKSAKLEALLAELEACP